MTTDKGAAPEAASASGRSKTARRRAGRAMRIKAGGLFLCMSATVSAAEICRRANALTEARPDAVTLPWVVFGIY